MNKKILTLIIVIFLIAIICGIVFAINSKINKRNLNDKSNQDSIQNEKTNIANNNSNRLSNNEENISTNKKILVVYFTQSGNTETVANFIHEKVGGDIVKLETVQSYPKNYNELVDFAQNEQKSNVRPELKTKIENIQKYDTIFLGYPNWWGDMPMPIYTFLDEYNLSEKTIAPFITHGGSGLSGTPNKIKKEEPNAKVTDGLAISGNQAKNSQTDVNKWLTKLGF